MQLRILLTCSFLCASRTEKPNGETITLIANNSLDVFRNKDECAAASVRLRSDLGSSGLAMVIILLVFHFLAWCLQSALLDSNKLSRHGSEYAPGFVLMGISSLLDYILLQRRFCMQHLAGPIPTIRD